MTKITITTMVTIMTMIIAAEKDYHSNNITAAIKLTKKR